MLPTLVGKHMLAFSRQPAASQRSLASVIDMAERRETQFRSSATKLRILNAARRQFAEDGYERTTIRSVATESDIDPSMVMRYFGSKEGLFAAAATFDLHLPDLTAVPVRQRGERLAQNFVDLWGRERMEGGLPILLRTAATNDSAAGRILKIFHEQVLPTVAAVAPDAAAKRSALIASQFLGIAYCRYVVRIPELAKLDDEIIVSALGKTIQRYLHDPIGKT